MGRVTFAFDKGLALVFVHFESLPRQTGSDFYYNL